MDVSNAILAKLKFLDDLKLIINIMDLSINFVCIFILNYDN